MMLLHGEENLEIYKPISPGSKYRVEEKILDCKDKGKFALLMIESMIKNAETNESVAKVVSTLIIRGQWGFGHKGTVEIKYPAVP